MEKSKIKVIAIDFDETITDNTPYPYKGKIRKEAIKYIKKLYEKGYKLVLWTARKEKYYFEALDQLRESDIYKYFSFDYLEVGYTGKLIADFYIDDRSLTYKINWKKMYKYITKRIK